LDAIIRRVAAVLLGIVAVLALILIVSVLADYGDDVRVERLLLVLVVFAAATFGAIKLWRRPSTAR
jgi:hypothetical protein